MSRRSKLVKRSIFSVIVTHGSSINKLLTRSRHASCNNLSGHITVCAENSPGGRDVSTIRGRSAPDQRQTFSLDRCYLTLVNAANTARRTKTTTRIFHWLFDFSVSSQLCDCSKQRLIMIQEKMQLSPQKTNKNKTCSSLRSIFPDCSVSCHRHTRSFKLQRHLQHSFTTFSFTYMWLNYSSYSCA